MNDHFDRMLLRGYAITILKSFLASKIECYDWNKEAINNQLLEFINNFQKLTIYNDEFIQELKEEVLFK